MTDNENGTFLPQNKEESQSSGDTFYVDTIRDMRSDNVNVYIDTNQALQPKDTSEIGQVIIKIVEQSNGRLSRSNPENLEPYSILDKINKNKMKLHTNKIIRQHNEDFFVIDNAISSLNNITYGYDLAIYSAFIEIYEDVLIELKIDANDEDSIISSSDEIYGYIRKELEIMLDDISLSVAVEKKRKYLSSLTAYVFYKCKFLIGV